MYKLAWTLQIYSSINYNIVDASIKPGEKLQVCDTSPTHSLLFEFVVVELWLLVGFPMGPFFPPLWQVVTQHFFTVLAIPHPTYWRFFPVTCDQCHTLKTPSLCRNYIQYACIYPDSPDLTIFIFLLNTESFHYNSCGILINNCKTHEAIKTHIT